MSSKVKVKDPVSKGVAKVPVVMQLEALECGAACLAMVLAYYEKWIPLEQVRTDCGVSRDGTKLSHIAKAAMKYGMEIHLYKYGVKSVMEKVQYPAIIHWNFNHIVVLQGFEKDRALINDPARGRVKVTMEETAWTLDGEKADGIKEIAVENLHHAIQLIQRVE